jgi:hypothetical protein
MGQEPGKSKLKYYQQLKLAPDLQLEVWEDHFLTRLKQVPADAVLCILIFEFEVDMESEVGRHPLVGQIFDDERLLQVIPNLHGLDESHFADRTEHAKVDVEDVRAKLVARAVPASGTQDLFIRKFYMGRKISFEGVEGDGESVSELPGVIPWRNEGEVEDGDGLGGSHDSPVAVGHPNPEVVDGVHVIVIRIGVDIDLGNADVVAGVLEDVDEELFVAGTHPKFVIFGDDIEQSVVESTMDGQFFLDDLGPHFECGDEAGVEAGQETSALVGYNDFEKQKRLADEREEKVG